MARLDASKFYLYRWRYIVGYVLIGLLLASLLLFAGLYVPGGISSEETTSVIQSSQVKLTEPSTWAVTNLPYHLLQKGILSTFGAYDFTIKLPSLILALGAAIGFILLLRRWFRPNIAVLAALIAITTGQFLFIAQSGAPGISYVFWPVILLLLGTQVTRATQFRAVWKFLFISAAALSLYTPLAIYPIIAIILAIILHPHLRNAVRKLSKVKIGIGAVIAAVILTPLALSIAADPHFGLTLLGVPTTWPPDLLANLQTLLKQYLLFWQPSTTSLMTPVFGLGSALLIGLGLYRIIRTRETTRSYLVIIWMLCLLPVLILNPRFTSVTFVLSVFLLAAGLTSLTGYWYRLFPLNPYARVAGLIPLIVLVGVLIGSGLDRYLYGYHYDPQTVANFSNDLKLIPRQSPQLLVADNEKDFYQVIDKYRRDIALIDQPEGDQFLTTQAARQDYEGYEVERIITSSRANDADRFYLYKKSAQ